MFVLMFGLEFSGGEGVFGGFCKDGDMEERGGVVGKAVVVLEVEVGVFREGSLGEVKVFNVWTVFLEDGEIFGLEETAVVIGLIGGFLEGVVINLMIDGVGF